MGRNHAFRVVFAILAVSFFVTPITLALLGLEAERFENRKLAQAPRLSQGWDAFGESTQYLIDHMPLRAQAVRANTTIWTSIFDTDPRYGNDRELARDPALPFAGSAAPSGGDAAAARQEGLLGAVDARRGRDGWLYLAEENEQACGRSISDERALSYWARLVSRLRALDHGTTMFVVPLKGSVYPERLPGKSVDRCALEAKREFWRHLAEHGPAVDVHELRSDLLRRKARHGDKLWQSIDSHWSTLGALSLVRDVVAAVGNGIEAEPGDVVKRGMVTKTADLADLDGKKDTERVMEYDIVRPAGAPRIPGRTMLFCDSYAYLWERLFKPYFEDLTIVPVYNQPEQVVDEIRKSDIVIVEMNELIFTTAATKNEKSVAYATAQGILGELAKREPTGD